MKKVFIDGSAGTTGLRIYERLKAREDIELIQLPEEKRKDDAARKEAMDRSDITFLCLPDEAAKAAAAMAGADTVVIDASSAHRVHPDFAYGFPELSAVHRRRIEQSKRISVPGCHASGFIALVYPLVHSGLLPAEARLVCHSLTGYSGGGKSMIAAYEAADRPALLQAPRQYAGAHRVDGSACLLPYRGRLLLRYGSDRAPVCQRAEGGRAGYQGNIQKHLPGYNCYLYGRF